MSGAPSLSLQERKGALRNSMRRLRAAVPPEERAAMAVAVEERLLSLPEVQAARTVLLFSSFGSEVRTTGIAARLRIDASGRPRRLLLPFLRGDEMRAAEYLTDDELIPTSYGPMEPERPEAVDPSRVDVVIAPGLAFDRQGHRLGYGGGHYDRYLALIRAEARRIGIAYHVQIVDEVPHGPGDERLDVVVTDRETILCPVR
jgi:5-formyltetrahydrofolate cyclo-ligase